jgi:tetratricopeptide (TPR) repeat protein
LQLARELGYRRHLPYLLYGLGWAFCELGDYLQAQNLCRQALDVAQEGGNLFAQAMALAILGRATVALHDYPQAQDYFEQGLRLSQVTQSMFCMSVTLAYLADLWVEQGRTEEAAELLSLALHHPASIKHIKEVAEQLLKGLRGKLPAKVLAAALERGKAMPLEEVMEKILRHDPLEPFRAGEVP